MLDYSNPNKEQIEEYLKSKGFEVKSENGQLKTNKCPFCKDAKIDWTHFYIGEKNGMYFCHRCGASGNLIVLAKHFGDYDSSHFKSSKSRDLDEPIKSAEEFKKPEKKELLNPSEKELNTLAILAENSHKTLMESKDPIIIKILNYLTQTRKLRIDTLKYFKIGWSGTAITIPLIEKGKVVNVRFRKSPFDTNDKVPKIWNSTGGKMTLFNVDAIKTNDKIVVTEGEFDAMSLFQEGWEGVVSITVGAQSFKEEWAELLKKVKTIYLCYDSDTAGQKGVEVAVSKLGAGRTYNILLPKGISEKKKDLNDFFALDKKSIDDFIALYNKAEKFKIDYDYIQHIKDAVIETKDYLSQGSAIRGLKTGYPLTDKLWGGMRAGDLIVISGDTNIGKTFYCQNVMLNLALEGVETMLFSLEQPVDEIIERFMLLNSGFNYRDEDEQASDKAKKENVIKKLDLACGNLATMPIYFYTGNEKLEAKLLGEVATKAVQDFGCKILFIDHLHYFAIGDRRYRTAEIGDIVRYVKLIARKLGIPIVLVVHLRKLESESARPTLDDLKDSSAIKQDADIVGLLYRERNKQTRSLVNQCSLATDKNRHGRTGSNLFTIGQGTQKEKDEIATRNSNEVILGEGNLCRFAEIENPDVTIADNPADANTQQQFDEAEKVATDQIDTVDKK